MESQTDPKESPERIDHIADGITCSYNPREPETLRYSISIQSDDLTSPKQAREYFEKIIDTVAEDASEKDGLDNLVVTVNQEYREDLMSTLQEMSEEARNQKNIIENPRKLKPIDNVLTGGMIIGGLAGLILGYDQMAELSVNAADYMNNASHLLAPLTGIAQTTISVGGTALTTGLGALIGSIGAGILIEPYLSNKTPLASKANSYESLEKALSK